MPITMGMLLLAALIARVDGVHIVTTTSGFVAAISSAYAASRFMSPSA